ncbi:glycoside hydrolase superfamily [Rhexocercosporidium sp. MPI-PUGE-AT-0058]|nr:glycoside hydrolase superfamily [Rhexocercosporidium sp. MPI-PUGE-AT-0058]
MFHIAIVLVVLLGHVFAVNNGLARVPQLGWNNWNALGCDVSEALLLDTAQILIDSGLRDVGYNYVVLDDCWASMARDTDDMLVADPIKFPNGMKYVSDRIHDMGLLFGMYSSAGEMTCARYPGSLDYETNDAKVFAQWGVDYLKYDNCFNKGRFGTPLISYQRYEVMWKALNATGRPILYSLCSWGEDYTHAWATAIANSYRMSGDVYDFFTRPDDLCSCDNPSDPMCIAPGKHCSVLNIINRLAPYADRSKPGAWADMDMLEVGNGGMSDDEYKAHFSMWAMLNSPLLMGNDLRALSPSALTILNNPAVIAINQDPLAKSAIRILRSTSVAKDEYGQGEIQIWSGKLFGGDQVVGFLNAANEDVEMRASLKEIFIREAGKAPQVEEEWDVYDLWANRMDEGDALKILEASPESRRALFAGLDLYNSTEVPYELGIMNGDSRLLGTKIGTVAPHGTLNTRVKKHSIEIFRLRSPNRDVRKENVATDKVEEKQQHEEL